MSAQKHDRGLNPGGNTFQSTLENKVLVWVKHTDNIGQKGREI